MLRLTSVLLVTVFFLVAVAHAQEGHITIDEDFSDWSSIEPHYDRQDDEGVFRRIRLTNDDRFLYLSIELATEVVLQSSDITLFIDTDDDPQTGLPVHGTGADLEWRFGERLGYVHLDGFELEIQHPTIGIVNAPTVSSTRFEIALRRDAMYGFHPIFGQDTIRIVLRAAESGDSAPRESDLSYTFQEIERPRAPVSLARPDTADVRILSYNVLRDGPFLGRDSYFTRILAAVQPDIIGFQEMYATTAAFVEGWLERDLPGPVWHVEKSANDVMLASRYPIIDVEAVWHHDQFTPRTAAFLVDLRPAVESDLLIYVTHTACCENNLVRQEHLDGMMAHLREKQNDLPPGTPFMLMGDFNLVTFESQRRTIIDGMITDNSRYGPSFDPDWDGTALADLIPLVTGLPMSFTWYDERSDFSPGRLDYIFFSDYALTAVNGFSLFTPALLETELEHYGLHEGDTSSASDHLPVVGDFVVARRGTETGSSEPFSPVRESFTLDVYPNPADDKVTIRISIAALTDLTVQLYDVLGREVRSVEAARGAASHTVTLDTIGLSPGLYFVRVTALGRTMSRSIIISR